MERTPGWPDAWGADFGLSCAGTGEDVRVCACVASEVQKKWTPEQLQSAGPEGLEAEARACRARVLGLGSP